MAYQRTHQVQLKKARSHPATIVADQRRKRAMELRMQGLTYKDVGREIGCSQRTARKIIEEVVQDRTREMDDLIRQHQELANMRLDALIRALWAKAMSGHVESVQAMVRVEERRAKLLGLDAPQRIQADVDLHALPEAELIAIAAQIGLATVMVPGVAGPTTLSMLPVGQTVEEAG